MSFDDEVVRINNTTASFVSLKERYKGFVEKITDRLTLKLVNDCQKTSESRTKLLRKQNEEREAKVFTKHKNIIYEQRMKILESNDKELVLILKNMITSYVNSIFERNFTQEEIKEKLGHLVNIEKCYNEYPSIYKSNIISELNKKFNYSVNILKSKYIQLTKLKMLKIIDDYWISHMETLENNWTNACYYAYSNMNPMEIYERQSIIDLQNMTYYIQNEMITYALNPSISYGEYEVKNNTIMEKGAVL